MVIPYKKMAVRPSRSQYLLDPTDYTKTPRYTFFTRINPKYKNPY